MFEPSSFLTRRTRLIAKERSGLSLIEIAAVVMVMGILAAAGMARFGTSTLENLGAQTEARRIALTLQQARRRAIATGDTHYVQFSPSSGSATSYILMRAASGGDIAVDESHAIDDNVTVTPSQANNEFSFDGTAMATYQITAAGPDRSWQISVVPATGLVHVVEIP